MDKYLTLVNKDQKFNPTDFEGLQMVEIVTVEGKPKFVETETAAAFEMLREAMLAENITIGYNDAGRTEEDRIRVYNELADQYGKEYADSHVAPEGASEHLTGLAIDVKVQRTNPNVITKLTDKVHLDRSLMYATMHKKLANYGFILRYPKGKEEETGYPHEPWHIRYVGREHALRMAKKGLTLESYVKQLQEEQTNLQQPGE